jgi:hypothetical protein
MFSCIASIISAGDRVLLETITVFNAIVLGGK